MFAEETLVAPQPMPDIVAALINSGELGDYVLYEHGPTVFLAGSPIWDTTVTVGQAQPWDVLIDAVTTHPHPGQPLYGWTAFELASNRPCNDPDAVLAYFFVPGVEVSFSGHAVQVRAASPEVLASVRSIIESAPPHETSPARGVSVDAVDVHYKQSVADAVGEIESGKLQKVILSRVVTINHPVNMLDTYFVGRKANTPARSFLLHAGGMEAAGFSPETVAEVSADGHVSTQPLAGTRALTGDETTDSALRRQLLSDPKEIFEHATSVKLACEELATVADDKGAWVSEFMVTKSRGSVQHLGSRVSCDLAADKTPWDALRVLFPAITASGIPKEPAFELIHRHEDTPRMLYSGAVIRCDAAGAIDAALVLRTIYRKDGVAWLRAGAGIVQGSRPEREHEETREKLSSVAPYVVGETP